MIKKTKIFVIPERSGKVKASSVIDISF